MKITRVIAFALLAGTLNVGALEAQSTSRTAAPAEFPPASYKGKQYVDSRGCVFIRAGIDGNVTWVPRVTRKRSVVCGFQPTDAGTQVAQAKPAAKAPEQITIDPAPAKPAAAARKVVKPRPAKPARVARAAPAPRKPLPVVRQQPVKRAPVAAPTPAPKTVTAAPAPRVAGAGPACPGASAISSRYINSNSKAGGVRCGPQAGGISGNQVAGAQRPVGSGWTGLFGTRRAAPAAAGEAVTVTVAPSPNTRVVTRHTNTEVTPHTRIVPRHVAVRRANTQNVKVPRGYKPAWDDDRLNPHRAEQTLAGRDQMLLVWTSSVPRRLINHATGKDLTASVALVYPYTDYATQKRELGEVTLARRADGKLVKRVVKNARASGQTIARAPVYSTRSAPTKPKAVKRATKARVAAPAPSAASGSRFVQVGTYTDSASAQRVGKKMRRMGLPVRIGKYTKNGQTLRMVIAGPFDSAGHTDRALRKVKQAGYGGAFARK